MCAVMVSIQADLRIRCAAAIRCVSVRAIVCRRFLTTSCLPVPAFPFSRPLSCSLCIFRQAGEIKCLRIIEFQITKCPKTLFLQGFRTNCGGEGGSHPGNACNDCGSVVKREFCLSTAPSFIPSLRQGCAQKRCLWPLLQRVPLRLSFVDLPEADRSHDCMSGLLTFVPCVRPVV